MNIEGLDALDNKILEVLNENARATFSEIGELVGLSRVAVKNRMEIMEKNGIIQGYKAIINPTKRRNGKLKFPIYISEKLRTTELEALELSVRSSNCLHRAGFKTIGELVEAIDGSEDLKKIRNCGSKSVDEIMEKLFCYQYYQLEATQKMKYINSVLDLNNARR